MRVLNLYAGIGGNRKLWTDVEVTAVELNPQIAKIYQDFFPQDKVIVADAHQYLLEHFKEYDFIWSSPPCPSHSRMNFLHNVKGLKNKYPDMKLYEEIILLNSFFKGKFVVENVKSYYEPLIKPQVCGGHYFWANFAIKGIGSREKVRNDKGCTLAVKMEKKGIVIKEFYGYDRDKRTLLNNAIEPELGLHILNESKREVYGDLFNTTKPVAINTEGE
jgi:DNA (cytosine-5)-methyltransferase 1